MNMDIHRALREERCRDLCQEAARARQLRELPRERHMWGRRVAGRLGSMMIAAGSRLEQIERGGKPAVCDL